MTKLSVNFGISIHKVSPGFAFEGVRVILCKVEFAFNQKPSEEIWMGLNIQIYFLATF